LPAPVERITGDALRAESYREQVPPADTFVHLIGTPRPSPAKAAEFRSVDLVSVQAAVAAALSARIAHFVYLSVAQPAPVMQAFVAVRREGEELIRGSGLPATMLRPWYVLGPGHRWPYLLKPFYGVLSLIPSTREGARRLGLVTRAQMIGALIGALENPPQGVRIIDVTQIRSSGG
jgi:uncharacterized protein YbjT (DUF2867 family)